MLSEEETRLRLTTIAALRVLAVAGLDDPMAGTLTVRAPDGKRFLASPMGVSWAVVQPDEMVAGTTDALSHGALGGMNIPAVKNNLGVLLADDALGAVLHAHCPYAVMLGVLGRFVEPFSQEACAFFEDQSIVEDRFDFDDPGRTAWLVQSFQDKKILAIRNHGVLVRGARPEEVAAWLIQYEEAARMQLRLLAMSNSIGLIPAEAARVFHGANGSAEAARAWYFARLTALQGEL